jgi:hypothetical protein
MSELHRNAPTIGRYRKSEPYRGPRSLQRLQTTELLASVKQVGSSVN